MGVKEKSKINFVIDEDILTHAKVYVAKNGGSLNSLVSAFLSNLGSKEVQPIDVSKRILMDVSTGKRSLMDATEALGLTDCGHVLRKLREEGLPLPRLSDEDVQSQVQSSRKAFMAAIVDRPKGKKRGNDPMAGNAAA